jgi:hypothetical protein
MLVYSLFGTAGATAGMLFSGVASSVSWRWAVLVPVPVVLVLVLLGLRHMPRDRPDRPRPPRVTAGLLGTATLARSALGAACLNGTSIGLFVVVSMQLQNGSGWQPWQAALVCMPAYATLALSVLLAGGLIRRWGTARLIAAGSLVAGAGCALYLWHPAPGSYGGGVLPSTVLLGAAYLCSFAALNAAASAGVPAAGQPVAGLVLQSAVQFGAVLTVVPAGVLLTVSPDIRLGLLPAFVAALIGMVVAITGLRYGANHDGSAKGVP